MRKRLFGCSSWLLINQRTNKINYPVLNVVMHRKGWRRSPYVAAILRRRSNNWLIIVVCAVAWNFQHDIKTVCVIEMDLLIRLPYSFQCWNILVKFTVKNFWYSCQKTIHSRRFSSNKLFILIYEACYQINLRIFFTVTDVFVHISLFRISLYKWNF